MALARKDTGDRLDLRGIRIMEMNCSYSELALSVNSGYHDACQSGVTARYRACRQFIISIFRIHSAANDPFKHRPPMRCSLARRLFFCARIALLWVEIEEQNQSMWSDFASAVQISQRDQDWDRGCGGYR